LCTVLIVDDDADTREMIGELIGQEGHAHFEAANGKQALEWLSDQERLPCVILLDLRMPVMDGWDFRQSLRSHPKWLKIPVIVVSATVQREGPNPLLNARDYWSKPPDAQQISKIQDYCETHRRAPS